MVNDSPVKAVDFILQEIPPGESQNEAALSILPKWAMVDFGGAEAWVELFPEGPIRNQAMDELANIDAMNKQENNGNSKF